MICKSCSHKFEPFEYLVICRDADGEKVPMCENCFFDMALQNLNGESVKMDYKGNSYYNTFINIDEYEKED